MEADTTAQKQYPWLTPYQWKPGVSGNPAGRPPGTLSIKEEVRKYLNEHPQQVEEMVKYFILSNREMVWQMLEGAPKAQTDITSKGESITFKIVSYKDDADRHPLQIQTP